MSSHLPRLVAALVVAFLAPLVASAQSVGILRAELPQPGRILVVRGTVFVPGWTGPFDRFACPFKLVDPLGTELATQWEQVARMDDGMVVELLAPYQVAQAGWNEFDIVLAQNNVSFGRYRANALALIGVPNAVRLVIEDQNGLVQTYSLSGAGGWDVHRIGVARTTLGTHVQTDFGNWHVWFTVDAWREQVNLTLNLHNGALPARPDLYFRSVRLEVPQGWTWNSQLPDPIVGNGYLIAPDNHVLPQRMERAFRLSIAPDGKPVYLAEEGWGVGDWSEGGYLAQSNALPILPNAGIDLVPDFLDAYQLLASNSPTVPGDPPTNPLWPAKGVLYGGMTGGIDIHQIPGVPLAMTGQRAGLLYYFVDQLRYGARHRSAIYEANGQVIELDDYANPDGSLPWVMFNSTFLGNPPMDQPFGFSTTGNGLGTSNYDPSAFDPIDSQHLVRRLNANRVLAWLANDPLAKLYLRGDAETARMTFYEGPGGRITEPNRLPAMGNGFGRGHAWAAEALLHAYATGDDAFRSRTASWFQRFMEVLDYAQMPNGLFSAVEDGKIAEDPPYGNGTQAFFAAHRSNEQIQLVHALRGIQKSVGLPSGGLIQSAGEGIWNFAWKPGFDGVLDRYPASPAGAFRRWAARDEIPAGLTNPVPNDGYHVGTVLTYALEEGAVDVLGAVLAHTNQTTLSAARLQLEAWGTDNLANRAPLVRFAQRFFP